MAKGISVPAGALIWTLAAGQTYVTAPGQPAAVPRNRHSLGRATG